MGVDRRPRLRASGPLSRHPKGHGGHSPAAVERALPLTPPVATVPLPRNCCSSVPNRPRGRQAPEEPKYPFLGAAGLRLSWGQRPGALPGAVLGVHVRGRDRTGAAALPCPAPSPELV